MSIYARKTQKNDRKRWSAALLSFMLCGCFSGPRTVPPSLQNLWPTSQGNERRAAFENETIPDSLHVAWDINVGAGLRASMLLTDSALFAGTTNRQLLAFSTRNGSKFWDQRFEGEIPGDLVRSGRTLFFATSEEGGRLHARDMSRGRRAWRKKIGSAAYGAIVPGNFVYVANDSGFVFSMHAADGAQQWRSHVHGIPAALPIDDGDFLIITTTNDSLFRLNKSDGAIVARGALDRAASATPARAGDTLVVPQFSGRVVAVSARDFHELWHVDTGAAVSAAPVITSDGVVHVLNRNAEIWRVRDGRGTRVASLGGAAAGSFTVTRNRYIVGRLDGTLLITDFDGRVVAQFKFNDSIPTPVAVQDGAVYVPFAHGRIVKLQ